MLDKLFNKKTKQNEDIPTVNIIVEQEGVSNKVKVSFKQDRVEVQAVAHKKSNGLMLAITDHIAKSIADFVEIQNNDKTADEVMQEIMDFINPNEDKTIH